MGQDVKSTLHMCEMERAGAKQVSDGVKHSWETLLPGPKTFCTLSSPLLLGVRLKGRTATHSVLRRVLRGPAIDFAVKKGF